jgi:hypothetical protein
VELGELVRVTFGQRLDDQALGRKRRQARITARSVMLRLKYSYIGI